MQTAQHVTRYKTHCLLGQVTARPTHRQLGAAVGSVRGQKARLHASIIQRSRETWKTPADDGFCFRWAAQARQRRKWRRDDQQVLSLALTDPDGNHYGSNYRMNVLVCFTSVAWSKRCTTLGPCCVRGRKGVPNLAARAQERFWWNEPVVTQSCP